MRRSIITILLSIAVLFLVVPVALGKQKIIRTYEFSLKSIDWTGKEHPTDSLERGIRSALDKLKIKPSTGDEIADMKVELSFKLERLWYTHPEDGQHLAIELPGTLILEVPGAKPNTISITVFDMRWIKFSSEGAAIPQRMSFATYDIAQEICKNLKGGFPEDVLWKSVSESLMNIVSKILKATIDWYHTGSFKEIESLLSNKDFDLRKSIISLLTEIKTQDAINLIQKISLNDKSERVRNEAKKALEKLGQSK